MWIQDGCFLFFVSFQGIPCFFIYTDIIWNGLAIWRVGGGGGSKGMKGSRSKGQGWNVEGQVQRAESQGPKAEGRGQG